MKTKKILFVSLIAIPVMAMLTSGTAGDTHQGSIQNAGGTGVTTGSPGELHTCSQATCHGAGNGNGTTGGLPDNAGPGNISITTVPAMVGNQYVPNTTYHISMAITETGKFIFGFNFEALDNSGNTDLHINNTAGTFTITDPTRTHTFQAYGSGRMSLSHSLNAGIGTNTSTFTFDWTSPAGGTVNFYSSAIAGDGDNFPDAQDNVYTKYILGLTPTGSTGITLPDHNFSFNMFPNPVNDKLTLSLNLTRDQQMSIQLFSLDGKLVKSFEDLKVTAGSFLQTYNTSGLDKGTYILKINSLEINECKRLIIN